MSIGQVKYFIKKRLVPAIFIYWQKLDSSEKRNAIKNFINPFFKPKIIILVSDMRTGSTLFCNLAAQYEKVWSPYEALNPNYTPYKLNSVSEGIRYLKGLSYGSEITIVKVFPQHLSSLNTNWSNFYKLLPDAIYIHLYRADFLARYISLRRAEITNTWLLTASDEPPAPIPIKVNIKEFGAFIQQSIADDLSAYNSLIDGRYLKLSYEDFAKHPIAWFHDTFDETVSLQHTDLELQYKKQGFKYGYGEVSNIDEVNTYFVNNHTIHPLDNHE